MSYKIKGAKGKSAQLTVPMGIARLIPEDARFECVLVEDGILYRRLVTVESELPSWVRRSE